MKKTKIYVAGHTGMVGSAITLLLKNKDIHLITKTRAELELTSQGAVQEFFKIEKPDQVYLAAGKVGGIYANTKYPAEFIYENLMIETNIIHAAFLNEVKKLLFLGSSSIYPKFVNQPISEDSLLDGPLEPTNEPYAIAKIAGIKICESYNHQYGQSHNLDYRSVMITNIYGPGDNYHEENSHVVAGLIGRFHQAKIKKLPKISIWGSGLVKREFIYVDDVARASIYVMNLNQDKYKNNAKYKYSHINVGVGTDVSIKELAFMLKEIVGYAGEIEFDKNKPDGIARKFLNSNRINNLGWRSEITLKEGLKKTYEAFLKLGKY